MREHQPVLIRDFDTSSVVPVPREMNGSEH